MAAWLETERLILRPPAPEDVERHVAYLMSDRSVFVGGKSTREDAWRRFAMLAGHWTLRGYGPWSVISRELGHIVGLVGAWVPDGWPEYEMSWSVHAEAEGKGIASEAARAARDHAYRRLGWSTMVSYIDPKNTRSIAMAERLGCRLDPDADQPDFGAPVHVYRHPSPEELS